MILVDEERVELFSAMISDLAGSRIYCWSEVKMDGGDIKVSRSREHAYLQSNVNEISKVTSTQVQDIREGSFLKGQNLGPESDAVIFFTSGYVSKIAQLLMTGLEADRKQYSVPSGWPSQISGLGLWVSSILYDSGQADDSPLPSSFEGRSAVTSLAQTK